MADTEDTTMDLGSDTPTAVPAPQETPVTPVIIGAITEVTEAITKTIGVIPDPLSLTEGIF
jgi:hypothetical protein